ncbi:MAG: hypothetical protein JNL39_09910 [Opitutaceae bacterium]|nr:hypothetical protein [Opitutaceae bacterium]
MSRALCCFLILVVSRAFASGSGPRVATVAEVALLNEVLQRTAADYPRWAYTEHRIIRDEKGRVKSDVLLRYDPSQPYAQQWTLLKVDGQDPSARDRDKYRKLGERAAPADPGKPAAARNLRRRVSLGELMDVPRASLAGENATHYVFEIPLRQFGNERFPPEKFELLARVRKEGEALENITVRLRESFRSKLVVKVKSGGGTLDFASVDPKHAPALVTVNGDASASVLFVSIGGSVSISRTEVRRVKPYDERFEVQIGDIKAIDF